MGALVAAEAVLDDGHAADALGVVAQLRAQLLQEAPVDVEDDLHVPRQQLLDQAHRPLLQRLRQHRVVGERKDLRDQPPMLNMIFLPLPGQQVLHELEAFLVQR